MNFEIVSWGNGDVFPIFSWRRDCFKGFRKNFWTRKGAGQNKSNERSKKIPKIHPGYYVNYITLLHNSIVHNA